MPPTRASGRARLLAGLLWTGLVAGGLYAADRVHLLPEAPDKWTYDWRTALLSPQATAPRDDITLVLVGEESLSRYPAVSPVDRGLVAALVRSLDKAGAKVIGLDFAYDRETDPAKTAALLEAIQNARAKIVLGAVENANGRRTDGQLAFQDDFLAKARRPVGHVRVRRDPRGLGIGDQVVRYRVPAMGEPPRRGFAEEIAAFDGPKPEPESAYIAWLRPPPKGGTGVFPVLEVPAHEPGAADEVIFPPEWRASIRDRIVLVGGDFLDRDQHLTPFSVLDGARVPGVAIQAEIVAQLRDGRSVYRLPAAVEVACLFLLAGLGFWIATRWRRRVPYFLVWLAGVIALVAAGTLLFGAFSLIIPSASIFFAWLAGVWGGHAYGRVARWRRHHRLEKEGG